MPPWFIDGRRPTRLLSLNDRAHWATRSREVAAWRHWAHIVTRDQLHDVPLPLPPCWVAVTLPVADKRRRDPHNFTPTLKAIVDGLVDARCWPDDTPEFVATLEPILAVRRDHLVTIELTPREH